MSLVVEPDEEEQEQQKSVTASDSSELEGEQGHIFPIEWNVHMIRQGHGQGGILALKGALCFVLMLFVVANWPF